MLNKTLPQLVSHYRDINEIILSHDGELTPQAEADLTEVCASLENKLDSCAFVIERLESEAQFWAEKASKLAAIARKHEKTAENLRAWLLKNMTDMKQKESIGSEYRLLVKTTKRVEITDEAKLSSDFLRTKTEPNKIAIRDALLQGKSVAGAALKDQQHLDIKYNVGYLRGK